MTLGDIFGINNVSVATVGGKTRVTIKRVAFPQISDAEANPTTGDIRKIVYGIMVRFVKAVARIKTFDQGMEAISVREVYRHLYSPDDLEHTTRMDFYIDPMVNDVKNEDT